MRPVLRRVARHWLSAPAVVLVATSLLTVGLAQAATCTAEVPMGAIAPARPIWCELLSPGRDTHSAGANSWVDNFNHGQSMATLNGSYVEGFIGNGDVRHFQHNEHWMVDIESRGSGALIGAWMRPNRSFRPQADGSLVVEFEVAGPIAGTRNVGTLSDSWPEMVLSTAPAPPGVQSWGSALRRNGTYLYEGFPGAWTFGCRMQQSKHPICALYRDDFGTAGTKPSRLWEINQNGGEVRFESGGDPVNPGLANVWKECSSVQDPDVVCRNQFRWEIRADEVKLFVNGVQFYHAGLIDSEMNNILRSAGGVYVYFGDFAYRMDPGRPVRFHWDHVAVNPGPASPPASGGNQSPNNPAPTPTPPPSSPVPTPSRTATAGAAEPPPPSVPGATTIAFDDSPLLNQVLSGIYPTNLIDWGTSSWYLSGRYGLFGGKSLSMTRGRTDAWFNFVGPERRVVSLDAFNGDSEASNVIISCGQSTRQLTIQPGQRLTISTGFTAPCRTVGIHSSNGWHTNFDNLVVR